jgi:predicted nucleic acid-binding protein
MVFIDQVSRKFADRRASFTDAVSFVLMKRYRIRTAFSFDGHFLMAGVEVLGLP